MLTTKFTTKRLALYSLMGAGLAVAGYLAGCHRGAATRPVTKQVVVLGFDGAEPTGFDVKDSPFGKLPDPNTYYSIGYPNFTLATLTDGYVFLVPFRKFQSVTVDDKFITAANLQEAIANFWDPEVRKQIKTPEDLLRLSRNDADEVAKFREIK